MSEIKKIVLIGAGNVGTQLGLALRDAGFTIEQVYSKTDASAKTLSKKLKCAHTSSLKKINVTSDLYLIAVKDDAITDIAKKLRLKNKVVVHTSGSAEMNVLKKISNAYGVFYPLQTFSKDRKIDLKEIPICVEGNNARTEKIILNIANSISNNVHKTNSHQRAAIHLAAVFACNFSNHMFSIAETLLSKQKTSFSLLHPLVMETVKKAIADGAARSQTGPAIRGDKKIIQKHLTMLKKDKVNRKLYKLLSKSIATSNK